MSILIVYKSNSGFTKKYVDWIQEELPCTSLPLDKVTQEELNKHETIVFGGGMHANRINGIKFLTTHKDLLTSKKLIVFATGATPLEATDEVERFRVNNVPSNREVPFFYFRSGMNYKNMKRTDKAMMTLYKTFLKVKSSKTANEKGTEETINQSCDYTDKKYILPLIEHLKNM